MRRTSRGAGLALLVVGCGFDQDPTGLAEPGIAFQEPAVTVSEPDFAAAAAATNFWTSKAPMPMAGAERSTRSAAEGTARWR